MPKRVDGNQREIVEALRKAGATVTQTHIVGHGFPDIAVGWFNPETGRAETTLIEIKMPGGSFTPDELAWGRAWVGTYYVVRSVSEALEVIGVYAETISRFERNVAQSSRA